MGEGGGGGEHEMTPDLRAFVFTVSTQTVEANAGFNIICFPHIHTYSVPAIHQLQLVVCNIYSCNDGRCSNEYTPQGKAHK